MKCIVCSHTKWKYLFTTHDRMFSIPGNFKEYQCAYCGHVRLDPKPTNKELQKYYPSKHYYSYTKGEKTSFFGRLRSYLVLHQYQPTVLSHIIEMFVRVPAMPQRPPGAILDIGCGSADTLVLLSAIGWRCYGLDIDRSAIDIAHKRGIVHASFGTYEDMKEYPDGFFDAVRLYHVIEHLDDPNECLRLAYRKLKPTGEIIIGTPNIGSLIARIAGQYWYNLDSPRHLYVFNPSTLRMLLKKNKFSPQKTIFCSAGGWVGSIQYKLEEILSKDIDLINRSWLVILFYPIEWILDKLQLGDVFVIHAAK